MRNICIHCGNVFHPGKWSWQEIETRSRQCMNCGKVTGMPNIKITAEVDGKQVPLRTISTESFEAIKALEKPKEIPVARLANHCGDPTRLLIRPTTNVNLKIGRVYSFDLRDGALVAEWVLEKDEYAIANTYENVKPL